MAMNPQSEDTQTRSTTTREEIMSEAEIEAAQQLMHLSDEENLSSSSSRNSKNNDGTMTQEEITSKKIEEIFGKDHEDNDSNNDRNHKRKIISTSKKNKPRKYRTLESIYMATRPLNVTYVKKGFGMSMVQPRNNS